MSKRIRLGIVVLVFVGAGLGSSWAQQSGKTKPPSNQSMPDLVAALKASPGCLGVETARTSSGKNVIFAWFDNKQAVLKWYKSDVHQGLMKKYFPGQTFRKPLKGLVDDSGPIMVIASLTMAKEAKFKEILTLPVSQIAIELYQPLPGGAALGGTFTPKSVKRTQFRDYTPDESK